MKFPALMMSRVMDDGTFEDTQLLVRLVGKAVLRRVIQEAEAGFFRPRSWAYWHHRLGLCLPFEVPVLPIRKVA